MKPIIKVENLSKRYRIGARQSSHPTLRDSLSGILRAPFGRTRQNGDSENSFWALKDVSFDIMPGEVVGVIGRNGAGKSTLLKILSRITEPTRGQVDIYGRVSSLLEVGTGFHIELSGRENIYLNGAILGMRRVEIDRKFDEIVAFAEIDKFIDTPVKHYSSGMYMRLAFAVAAHLEPEILLVDEVLAVGDAAFQNKCLGKMRDIGSKGRTIFFVSHNMSAVQNLCPKVLLLSRGEIEYSGPTEEGLKYYLLGNRELEEGRIDVSTHSARQSAQAPLVKMVRLLDKGSKQKSIFSSGEKVVFEVTLNPSTHLGQPEIGIGVNDALGGRVFTVATYLSDSKLPSIGSQTKIICEIDELTLAPGDYYLTLSAGNAEKYEMDDLINFASFKVVSSDFYKNGKEILSQRGKMLVRSKWQVGNL
jgi:lipopolysaccharide transport system ATP-binding protein